MKTVNREVVREVNYKVENAGYWFNPDIRELCLRLEFSNCIVRLNMPDSKHNAINKLWELSKIFEIDDCNGVFIKNITGKYCRLLINEDDIPIKIKHIIKDNVMSIYDVKEE